MRASGPTCPRASSTRIQFFSSKTPLFDASGEVIGIAGVMRDYAEASAVLQPYQEMQQVVDHVFHCYGTRLEVPQLARMAHLSISQFDRRRSRYPPVRKTRSRCNSVTGISRFALQ